MFGRGRFFRRLMARVLGGLKPGLRFLELAAFRVLGLTFRVVIGPAPRFLGGGKDRNRFLFAAFGVAFGRVALLLDQGALPRRAPGAARAAGPAPRAVIATLPGVAEGAPAADAGVAGAPARFLRTSTCTTLERP